MNPKNVFFMFFKELSFKNIKLNIIYIPFQMIVELFIFVRMIIFCIINNLIYGKKILLNSKSLYLIIIIFWSNALEINYKTLS